VKSSSGWGELVMGLFWLGVSTRRLMAAVEQHEAVWKIGFYGSGMLFGVALAIYGVLKWRTPRHLKEQPPGRHSLAARDRAPVEGTVAEDHA
jgi:hypothetical protein